MGKSVYDNRAIVAIIVAAGGLPLLFFCCLGSYIWLAQEGAEYFVLSNNTEDTLTIGSFVIGPGQVTTFPSPGGDHLSIVTSHGETWVYELKAVGNQNVHAWGRIYFQVQPDRKLYLLNKPKNLQPIQEVPQQYPGYPLTPIIHGQSGLS